MKRLRAGFHRRREGLTTSLLILLILSSLVWTALIWTGTPAQVAVDRPGFFSHQAIGGSRTVGDLVVPSALFLWTANNELYRLSGDSQTALSVTAALKGARILSGNWLHKQQVLPPVGAYLQINVNDALATDTPLSLWLGGTAWRAWPVVNGPVYVSPTGASNRYSVRYKTSRGVWQGLIGVRDARLANAFIPNNQATPYALVTLQHLNLYLPYDQITMPVEDWSVQRPMSAHVIDGFFTDPTSTVTLTEGNHSTLYTDGTRGVRVTMGAYGEHNEYMAPNPPLAGGKAYVASDVATAVAFVNQNGGFVGQDYLTVGNQTAAGRTLRFQEIVAGWPLFSSLDQMELWVQNGTVTRMQRNLPYLQYLLDQRRVTILSGSQLLEQLGAKARNVQTIRLGYSVRMIGSSVAELIPVYQVVAGNGVTYEVDAQSGSVFAGARRVVA